MSTRPQQSALVKPPAGTTTIDLARPAVWPSSVFPGRQIAVSIRDIQLLCPSKHGPPPDAEARMFLLYCAGWGVDPRIGQGYLIPFEITLDSGSKKVTWQMGLHHQVFMFFATAHGTITGHKILPDPAEWPLAYPGDDFAAKIIVLRRKPLLNIEYGCRLGSVAQKYQGKLSRAWADGKVGWAHMFQVALKRRGYRDAMAMGGAYAAEEFGEVEPEYAGAVDQVEFLPPAAETPVDLPTAPATEFHPPAAPPTETEGPEGPPCDYPQEADSDPPADEEAPAYGDPPTETPPREAAPPKPEAPRIGSPCPQCGDGAIALRRGKNGNFLACSFYRQTGCNWTMDAPEQP